MKLANFYEVVKMAAVEVVGYTFPTAGLRTLGNFCLGALFGANVSHALKNPRVVEALNKGKALGIVDEAGENVDTNMILAGLNMCIQQDSRMEYTIPLVGNIVINKQEFETLAKHINAAIAAAG